MDRISPVLVVDDDPATRHLLTAVFKREHMEVECVGDGEDVLARLVRRAYSAVLLDLMMPRVNGFDVIQRLSESMPHMLKKIIVVTAVSNPLATRLEVDRQIWAVLPKPFDLDDLLRMVRDCARASASSPVDGDGDGNGDHSDRGDG